MITPHMAAIQDRALQLRVGDWIQLDTAGSERLALLQGEVAAVRRSRKFAARVQIALRLDGGNQTDWIDALHVPAVHDATSYLAERFRNAIKGCPECGEPRLLKDFYRHGGNADGRFTVCRGCWGAYTKARHEARRAARAVATSGAA